MMGRQTGDQSQLFYEFRLEDRIPENHLLRRINAFVTAVLADLHEKLEPYYSDIGRPSVDPELMIRMLIVGYCYGIRSNASCARKSSCIWPTGGSAGSISTTRFPHHSTFSENRLGRFRESDLFRHIFERVVVRACMALAWSRAKALPSMPVSWRPTPAAITARRPTRSTGRCRSGRRGRWRSSCQRSTTNDPDPDRKPPKVISPSDPSSAWTAKANKRVQFGYGLNYLIDIENAVIVDVEATPARTYDEVDATKTMIDRTEQRFDLKPKRLAADTAYGTGRFLGWLVGRRITPHIPVRDKSERDDGTFSRSDFRWDKTARTSTSARTASCCSTTGTVHDGRTLLYRASKLRLRCLSAQSASAVPNDLARKIPRDLHEDARDVARRKMRTKAFVKSRDERKRVEMRFAHLKTHHGFERMRLRGLSGARDEFHLAAIVQNLKTLANHVWPPPPKAIDRCAA